ncbi:hypothetical protein KIPB_000637, partial [Kipferlia bialata]|eukprot:g637.t1
MRLPSVSGMLLQAETPVSVAGTANSRVLRPREQRLLRSRQKLDRHDLPPAEVEAPTPEPVPIDFRHIVERVSHSASGPGSSAKARRGEALVSSPRNDPDGMVGLSTACSMRVLHSHSLPRSPDGWGSTFRAPPGSP